jgi:hypothetical protein
MISDEEIIEMVHQSDSAGQYWAENTWLISFARLIAQRQIEIDADLIYNTVLPNWPNEVRGSLADAIRGQK